MPPAPSRLPSPRLRTGSDPGGDPGGDPGLPPPRAATPPPDALAGIPPATHLGPRVGRLIERVGRGRSAVALLVVAVSVATVVTRGSADPTALPMAEPAAGAAATPSAGAPSAGAPAGAAPDGASATTVDVAPVVHVAGAVVSPGLVRLAAGARVADAVAAAGGVSAFADLGRVNLAAPVGDGERVYVPALGEAEPPAVVGPDVPDGGAGGGAPGSAPAQEAPVDLNAATLEQLDALPGVGPATAAAIVEHRDTHGPFATVDALLDVRGIGPAKLEGLRDLVVVR